MENLAHSLGRLVRSFDRDILGGFTATYVRTDATIVFYGTVQGEMCTDGYRLFTYAPAYGTVPLSTYAEVFNS